MNEQNEQTTQPLPRKRRRIWKSILLGFIILLCGMVIGSGLTIRFIMKRIQQPEMISQSVTREMKRKLDLTPSQLNQIQDIFSDAKDYFLDLRHEVRPLVLDELRRVQTEVDSVLTPRQSRKWNRWFNLRKRFWLEKLNVKDLPREKSDTDTSP